MATSLYEGGSRQVGVGMGVWTLIHSSHVTRHRRVSQPRTNGRSVANRIQRAVEQSCCRFGRCACPGLFRVEYRHAFRSHDPRPHPSVSLD